MVAIFDDGTRPNCGTRPNGGTRPSDFNNKTIATNTQQQNKQTTTAWLWGHSTRWTYPTRPPEATPWLKGANTLMLCPGGQFATLGLLWLLQGASLPLWVCNTPGGRKATETGSNYAPVARHKLSTRPEANANSVCVDPTAACDNDTWVDVAPPNPKFRT